MPQQQEGRIRPSPSYRLRPTILLACRRFRAHCDAVARARAQKARGALGSITRWRSIARATMLWRSKLPLSRFYFLPLPRLREFRSGKPTRRIAIWRTSWRGVAVRSRTDSIRRLRSGYSRVRRPTRPFSSLRIIRCSVAHLRKARQRLLRAAFPAALALWEAGRSRGLLAFIFTTYCISLALALSNVKSFISTQSGLNVNPTCRLPCNCRPIIHAIFIQTAGKNVCTSHVSFIVPSGTVLRSAGASGYCDAVSVGKHQYRISHT